MSATRCGISAKQIERETGVTYKTAWRMFRQIRSMLNPESSGPIGGWNRKVEMDESYFGGKRKAKGAAITGDPNAKTSVVGMVQRKGEVRAFVAADIKADTLIGLAKEHILPQVVSLYGRLHRLTRIRSARLSTPPNQSQRKGLRRWRHAYEDDRRILDLVKNGIQAFIIR